LVSYNVEDARKLRFPKAAYIEDIKALKQSTPFSPFNSRSVRGGASTNKFVMKRKKKRRRG
jgi:hypothetical protein